MAKKAVTTPKAEDNSTAKAVASAMAKNMARNQDEPGFEMEKARREGVAADAALRKHGLHPGNQKKDLKPAQ